MPTVGNKCHFDPTHAKGEANGAVARGKLVFEQFLNPVDAAEVMAVQVVIDHTVRQCDPMFLQMVSEMHSGNGMSEITMDMLLSWCLDWLPPAVQAKFLRDALCIMLTWKSTMPIIKEYLLGLKTDVC